MLHINNVFFLDQLLKISDIFLQGNGICKVDIKSIRD